MIAKLEWTQLNIEQLQNSTMGVTINNESTTEPPATAINLSSRCSLGEHSGSIGRVLDSVSQGGEFKTLGCLVLAQQFVPT